MLRRLRLQPSELPLEGDDAARFLPWLIAVMVFLASLTLAASLAIDGTADLSAPKLSARTDWSATR